MSAKVLHYNAPKKPWLKAICLVLCGYALFAAIAVIALHDAVSIMPTTTSANPIIIELAESVTARPNKVPTKEMRPESPHTKALKSANTTAIVTAKNVQLADNMTLSDLPKASKDEQNTTTARNEKKWQETQLQQVEIQEESQRLADKSTSPSVNNVHEEQSDIQDIQWKSLVLNKLQKMKRYPPYAQKEKQEDVIVVQFSVDANGLVVNFNITQSQHYELLDREVVLLIQRVSPLPPPPPSLLKNGVVKMTVPVNFFVAK